MCLVLLWSGRVERSRDALVLQCELGCGRGPIWAGFFGGEEGRDMSPARRFMVPVGGLEIPQGRVSVEGESAIMPPISIFGIPRLTSTVNGLSLVTPAAGRVSPKMVRHSTGGPAGPPSHQVELEDTRGTR